MCSRHADASREVEALALASRERERRAGIGHRMQVEQVIGRVVDRAQLAGARELRRTARGPSSTSALHSRL
jgi:hypothetical protein